MIKFIDCVVYQGTKKIPIDAHEAYIITKDLENIQFVSTSCTLQDLLLEIFLYLINVIFLFITINDLFIMNKNLLKIISVQK